MVYLYYEGMATWNANGLSAHRLGTLDHELCMYARAYSQNDCLIEFVSYYFDIYTKNKRYVYYFS